MPFVDSEMSDLVEEALPGVTHTYERRKKEVTKDIKIDFSTLIAAWCPMGQVRPDFVATVLCRYDEDVVLQNKWSFLDSSGVLTWTGVVAEFTDKDTALAAAAGLEKASKYVKTLELDWLLDQFIEAELKNPMCGIGSTRVFVRAAVSLSENAWDYLERMLCKFGDVQYIRFFESRQDFDAVCEVGYKFASQAFAVKLLLDGHICKYVGRLEIQVLDYVKEREIEKSVKRKMANLLAETNHLQMMV